MAALEGSAYYLSSQATSKSAVVWVQLNKIGFKLTLNDKHLSKPVAKSLLVPFLTGYNKKVGASGGAQLTLDDIESVTVIGEGGHDEELDKVEKPPFTSAARAVLGGGLAADIHRVVIKQKPRVVAPVAADDDDEADFVA